MIETTATPSPEPPPAEPVPPPAPPPPPVIQQVIVKEVQVQVPSDTQLLDMLARLLTTTRSVLALPTTVYHAVIVPDMGEARVSSFETVDGLLACLRELHGQDVQVFPFAGQQLAITTSPRYLLTPQGKFPLFAMEAAEEVDAGGFMGKVPVKPPPTTAAITLADDAEEDDVEDDIPDEEPDEEAEDEALS